MKTRLKYLITPLIIFLLSCVSIVAFAQKDQIEGNWYTEGKESKINIYKASDGKFYGKLIWLLKPDRDGKPKRDIHNIDASQRDRAIMGMIFLNSFVKNGNVYEDGTVYNPKNGKTYSCKMTYKGKTLDIRGYIGISLFGKSITLIKAD